MVGAAKKFFIGRAREKVRQAVSNSIRNIPRATTFTTTYTADYNANLHHVPWVYEDPCHLLHIQCMESVQKRPREGLWWSVTTAIQSSPKKVVRSWTNRRIKVAFMEALKRNGYDSKGIAIVTPNENLKRDLHGSLRLIAQVTAVTAPKSLIDAELSNLVECLTSISYTPLETGRNGNDIVPLSSNKTGSSVYTGKFENLGILRRVAIG